MNSMKCADMVSGVTHDLKSPLNAILGYAEMAIEDLKNISGVPKDTLNDLNMITTLGKDMSVLISNILTSARIQSGQQTLLLTRISREELIEQLKLIEKTFHAEARSKRIEFSMSYSQLPEYVYWDIQSLRYFAINNLISNALKFVGNNGIVKLHIDTNENDTVTMSISDNGPGIPEDERESIFNKFSQASNNVRSFSGSGYGLFNAAKMITAHCGSIKIQNGIDEKGVSFILEIQAKPLPDVKILPAVENLIVSDG